jgi:hypothetical protein
MGVAPEVMVGYFVVDHRLKFFFDFFQTFLFFSSSLTDVSCPFEITKIVLWDIL